MPIRFVEVPGKEVEFEDGRVTSVPAFQIGASCVTIAQFREFERATGYVSLAERDPRGKPFYLNELVEHFSDDERADAEAFCVSFLDATSFCEWARVRLPSEAEWLAASIADERIYDRRDRASWPRPPAGGDWRIKMSCGQELTSTRVGPGDLDDQPSRALGVYHCRTCQRYAGRAVVLRGGPWYFRTSDWRDCGNRKLAAPEEWDLFFCFRVATDARTQ